MSNIAIKVENLGKLYRLGEIGTGTLNQDLKRWWAVTRGKEDPFAKIGETNDRTQKGDSDFVWALKDVSFDVQQGEVLGIIGRNGAGKSTLLKLLSKVTQPTTGRIKVKGRIASLLEVGTGFHPDLSGRENIFLNGAILGMTKREIQSKFDEIVNFAGVERYIDTPVKRYSSGMYVRLAFAVAAFLEPEILIVDEVLAVGDAEFQKKCLGRMKDVSLNEGRTVLFVSHNLAAVKQLCKNGIVLDRGRISIASNINDALDNYKKHSFINSNKRMSDLIKINHSGIIIKSIKINDNDCQQIELDSNLLHFQIEGVAKEMFQLNLEIRIYAVDNVLITFYSPGHLGGELKSLQSGNFVIEDTVLLPDNMANGEYTMSIELSYPNVETYISVDDIRLIKNDLKTLAGRSLNYNEIGFFLMKRYEN